jgi:glycosyltransferase involved in cell wall biosynthesis
MANKPTLHLIGLFHTQSNNKFSHCAFTGKALRFPKMMQLVGYEVIEYSNEGSESTADEHVMMLSKEAYDNFFGHRKKTDFFGDSVQVGSNAHVAFEKILIHEMRKRVSSGDIICHPFGHAHSILLDEFPANHHVETGIGYPITMGRSFKIFESYAWMHYHQGKENRQGINYEWVIPNYYDIDEWKPKNEHGDYIAFLGRIYSNKGLDTILEVARRVPYPIKLAGQGDPSLWSHPNIKYVGPLEGRERSDFLRNAYCAIMPTVYTEPFGGSGVEAMLCGTPLIASDYGAFTETVINNVTGFRCKTLGDWVDAIEEVRYLDREQISGITRSNYSLETCSRKYDKVFTSLDELNGKGWYSCDNFNLESQISCLQGDWKTALCFSNPDEVPDVISDSNGWSFSIENETTLLSMKDNLSTDKKVGIVQMIRGGENYDIFRKIWGFGVRPKIFILGLSNMLPKSCREIREILLEGGYRIRREDNIWFATQK